MPEPCRCGPGGTWSTSSSSVAAGNVIVLAQDRLAMTAAEPSTLEGDLRVLGGRVVTSGRRPRTAARRNLTDTTVWQITAHP